MASLGRFDVVLPPEERYGPEGGAVATVAYRVTEQLAARGAHVRVIGPAVSGTSYAAGEAVQTRFGRREPVADAWRAARRRLRRSAGDPHDRYRDEVADVVGDAPVIVHNDAVLAARLAELGHDVTLWLHNLLTGRDGEALARGPAGMRMIAVSGYVRTWTAERHGVDPRRITVVHNGVDVDAFHPDPRWQPGPVLRVVAHGRIDPNKGQLLAARAVARLRAEGVPVALTIVGAPQTFGMPPDVVGAYLADLTAAARQAGAQLTGRIPPAQVPDALRRADAAAILPTVPDPFMLAGLEAMASGCAVVAVPLGGVDEVVGDAVLRVGPEADEVAEALRRLATDPALLRERREAARRRALGFTWERAVDTLLSTWATR